MDPYSASVWHCFTMLDQHWRWWKHFKFEAWTSTNVLLYFTWAPRVDVLLTSRECWIPSRDEVELIKQVLPKFCNPWDHSCTKSAGSGLKIKLSIQDDSGWFRFLHLPVKLCGLFVGQKNDWVRQATKEVDGVSTWMSNSHDFNNANRLQQHFRCDIPHFRCGLYANFFGKMLLSETQKNQRTRIQHPHLWGWIQSLVEFGLVSPSLVC